MPNKTLLIRFVELKIQEKQIADEIKMIKDQCQTEVETALNDAEEQHLELSEMPGYIFMLAKAPAKWEYSEQLQNLLKEVEASKKDEEADGRATNLNEGRKILKFNMKKDE